MKTEKRYYLYYLYKREPFPEVTAPLLSFSPIGEETLQGCVKACISRFSAGCMFYRVKREKAVEVPSRLF